MNQTHGHTAEPLWRPGAVAENSRLADFTAWLEQENEVLRRAAAYLSQANLPKN